ncbi:hypothetical protein MKX08_006535 [Trichoderma sp. CBMAI-0020]|nr:hypothetical protein MKX08_006535 [Trichoderma sp. CBMAI-0020]
MPLWTCDFEQCCRPAVRKSGDCLLCNRHLCSIHLQPSHHTCPEWKDADVYDPAAGAAQENELETLIARVNIRALEDRASHLRQGIPCFITPLTSHDVSSMMGGMNHHIDVCFRDGMVWIARIRRSNCKSPPPPVRDYIFQSEVATLEFLHRTNVPVPRVFDFALEHPGNPVGVGFILMEKLPGKALQWATATLKQKQKVMQQMMDIYIELHKYPFQLFGSLNNDTSGAYRVGAIAQEVFMDFEHSTMRTTGPFSSPEQYYYSLLQKILESIVQEEMYSQMAVDAYLIHRFLIDLVPSVISSHSQSSDQVFYLKHTDDKGDHILVDQDFNITGIIDWEWAQTAPAFQAFKSPIGFLPVQEFYNGNNNLGDDEVFFARLFEEKGRQDLADCVWKGRLQHRFEFCCGYDLEDWEGFLGLFKGLRDAAGLDGGLEWEEWKAVALQRYKNDSGLQQLLSKC